MNLQFNIPQNVKLFISEQALHSSEHDNHIIENIHHFIHEIQMIIEELHERHQEMIGHFRVSPRGHTPNRVAWHMDKKDDFTEVFIDNFLYHKNMKYNDNWIEKVKDGKITLDYYNNYQEF
jgi:Na+-transporting NADH:ubiquinone oxidoreductase subunit NqrF